MKDGKVLREMIAEPQGVGHGDLVAMLVQNGSKLGTHIAGAAGNKNTHNANLQRSGGFAACKKRGTAQDEFFSYIAFGCDLDSAGALLPPIHASGLDGFLQDERWDDAVDVGTRAGFYKVPMLVGEDLNLNVTSTFNELFEVDAAVAEGGLGFVRGHGDGVFEAGLVVRKAHTFTAAARRGFHQNGETDMARQLLGLGGIRYSTIAARNHRHAGRFHFGAAGGFVAGEGDSLWGRADEGDLAVAANAGELRVLREKAVARVNRLGIGNLGGSDKGLNLTLIFELAPGID